MTVLPLSELLQNVKTMFKRGMILQPIKLFVAILICAVYQLGQAALTPKIDPISLGARVNGDVTCTGYKITGLCRRNGVFVGYRVNMFVPVAFVETVGAPGDTLLVVPNFSMLLQTMVGAAFTVGQSNKSGMDNSWEAKVWTLPDSVMLMSTVQPKCLTCMPSDSFDESGPLPPLPTSGCDAANVVTKKMMTLADSIGSIPFLPKLSYATEADFLNWRTGCRDMTLSNWLKANPFTCMASSVGDLATKVGANNPLREYLGESCLGTWGALYPRQMRDVGNVAPVASAKTAYRALSVARTQLGSVRFPVNMDGKLQQAYPSVSACFHPGDSPLPQLPLSLKPVISSPDGAYGWIYWRPVSCCVSVASVAQCAKSIKN